jgi:hypothetical protein
LKRGCEVLTSATILIVLLCFRELNSCCGVAIEDAETRLDEVEDGFATIGGVEACPGMVRAQYQKCNLRRLQGGAVEP